MKQYGAAILRGVTLPRGASLPAFCTRHFRSAAGASPPGGFLWISMFEGRNILLLFAHAQQFWVAGEPRAEPRPSDVTFIQYLQLLQLLVVRRNRARKLTNGTLIQRSNMQITGTKYARNCQLLTRRGKSNFRGEWAFQ